jgi:hypothetical protein
MALNDRYNPYGDVWIGDLLHAVAHTTIGDAEQCVAWGLDVLGLSPGIFPIPAKIELSNEPDRDDERQAEDTQTSRGDQQEPDRQIQLDRQIPFEVVRQEMPGDREEEFPEWYVDTDELAGVDDEQLDIRPPFLPLFRPGTTRALLSTALATPSGEGDIDLDVIIEWITQLRPVIALPRKRLSSIRLGIQLLIDRGVGMSPFITDRELLVGLIRRVVGCDSAEILYFSDSPLRKVDRGDRFSKRFRYEPPTAGTPVVVLTDLGIAGQSSTSFGAKEEEWLRFVRLVHGAECPVLAFTPYGPKRWPPALKKRMYILQWDRATNVSVIRRAVGRGLELKRQT